MKSPYSLAEKVRRGEPLPLPVAALLSSATPIVRLGMWWRLHRKHTRVNARVISFGNITAGGTGKTPAVIERAIAELAAGHRVAVLTRGYGATKRREPVVVPPGAPREGLFERVGDEAALIALLARGVVVVKCADRVRGARIAIAEHGCDTLILDDGFQAVALERDENVLLIDAAQPFGNGRLVPRGILREPLEAMARATHILLTRCDQAQDLDALVAQVEARCPGRPIRRTRHAPSRLWRVATEAPEPLETLSGVQVTAVCGIARPEAFVRTVEELGAQVVEVRAFPDHGHIPSDAFSCEGLVVTTEKDAMRLADVGENVLALGIELRDL